MAIENDKADALIALFAGHNIPITEPVVESVSCHQVAQVDTSMLIEDRIMSRPVKVMRLDGKTGKVLFDLRLRRGIRYALIGPIGEEQPGKVLIYAGGNFFRGNEEDFLD